MARSVNVTLEEGDLWDQFKKITNEMIVTKAGRRMFPVIKVDAKGLEPNAFYAVYLEFKQIDNNRWKYINGEWIAGNLLISSACFFDEINRAFKVIFQLTFVPLETLTLM